MYTADRNIKCKATFKNSLAVSQKVRWPRNSIPRHLSKRMKPYVHTKDLNFQASLFVTVKNWKQSKCPSTGQQIKQNMVYPYIKILFSNKKKQNIDACYNMDESSKHVKKPEEKDYIFYVSIYMKYSEKENL